ncbi:anamorsin homolog 2-like [Magnolia sinica]|uniref:anamorsin homolog 2-like n=1 Tax=Magnolia sinica TaxID=86752 RepID=UPI002658CE18|nr:anamorsin homolog 2-like [Magnolia sinica]
MEIEEGVLIITDSISINASVVVWALQHFSISLKDLRIITQASLLEGNLYFKSASLSAVVSISEKPSFHTQLWLLELAKVLKPGGSVFLQEPSFFDENKEIVLRESRASIERNLLFAGFSSLEGFECLDHSAEIDTSTQSFELIAIKAKRPWDTGTSTPLQKKTIEKGELSVVASGSNFQPQIDDIDDLIDEDTLLSVEDFKKPPELPLDGSYQLRERIRERNRLYQRRRRARMTEDQRKRERERRRQYMQSRRVQPISYEMPLPLPISYSRPKECEQGPQCGQQLRETRGIETEKNPGMGEAGEAS